MSASRRPGMLQIGDRVRFDGATLTVVGLSGTVVRLAGSDGRSSAVQLAVLLASDRFEVVGGRGRRMPPQAGLLDTLPKQVQEEEALPVPGRLRRLVGGASRPQGRGRSTVVAAGVTGATRRMAARRVAEQAT